MNGEPVSCPSCRAVTWVAEGTHACPACGAPLATPEPHAMPPASVAGWGWTPPPAAAPVGLALAAAFLFWMPVVGTVLAIIALSLAVRRRAAAGRGQAFSGAAIAGASVALGLSLLVVAGFVWMAFEPAGDIAFDVQPRSDGPGATLVVTSVSEGATWYDFEDASEARCYIPAEGAIHVGDTVECYADGAIEVWWTWDDSVVWTGNTAAAGA